MTLYIPAQFRVDDREAQLAFMRDNAFATLVTSAQDDIVVSHIPFIVESGADGAVRLLGHVARANPHWEELENARTSVAIFQGPHAYISPTWYENHPAVPTWNYAVVHAHVRARLMDEAGLRDLLQRLSARYEAGRPKPWRMEDQPADFVARLVPVIVGFTLEVERIEAKFKLSQNRPGADAERVRAELESAGEPALAALMRAHPPPRKG